MLRTIVAAWMTGREHCLLGNQPPQQNLFISETCPDRVSVRLPFHIGCKQLKVLDLGVGSFKNVSLSLCDLPKLDTLTVPDGFLNVQVQKMEGVENLHTVDLFMNNRQSTWSTDTGRIVVNRNDGDGNVVAQRIAEWLNTMSNRSSPMKSP